MLSSRQQDILLGGLNPTRISQRKGGGGKQLSYLEAWDVKAHLIRVFGFGGFNAEVLSAELMFESQNERNWEVGYKVVLQLTIHDIGGRMFPLANGSTWDAVYTEAAVGGATLPSRSEAHDMAVKTAESDALKRAAINLGDQFGLSLYNNGSVQPVVKQTLAGPPTTNELIANAETPKNVDKETGEIHE